MYDYNNFSDNENINPYSSKKTVLRYQGFLIMIGVLAVGLISAFGIRAYQISQIDPFEKPGSTLGRDYFLSSAKDYFDQYTTKLPVAGGTCSDVALQEVQEANMMSDIEYYNKCDKTSTYVKVCKLENGGFHFEVHMECGETQVAYTNQKEIVDEDEIINSIDAKVHFSFQLSKLNTDKITFGDVINVWKDEIFEENYKILSETTYYRTRDKLWRYNGDVNYYYPDEKTSTQDVVEYYLTPPTAKYRFKEISQNYAYKWYLQPDETGIKYYYPSGVTDPNKEPTHYLVAPVKDAQRDDDTKTFAAKYFRVEKTSFSKLFPTAPSSNAQKIKNTDKWGEWSEYDLTIPKEKPYEDGQREIESRIRVDIIPIYSSEDNLEWETITNDYINEKEMIKKLQSMGYQVNSINDILGLKDIKYNIKQTYQEAA